MAEKTTVKVKSAWESKINWTQAVGVVAGALALFGIDMDAQTQANILAGIIGIQSVLTWVQRTWFTTAITQASAEKVQ